MTAGKLTETNAHTYLAQHREGEILQIQDIEGGKGARKKMFDLGLVPGSTVEIMQGIPNHPYILKVGGTRIMLGWGMVQKILVT